MAEYVKSYYADTRRITLADTRPLAGSSRADVAIVGGGITGCSAALHLAERGYKVTLLEAKRIGWGASGRSGGQILNGFGTDIDVMAKDLGQQGAKAAWEMSREAVRLTTQLIEKHAIDCDFARGAIDVAVKPRHVRSFEAHVRTMRDTYGYDQYQWLDRTALREHVRSDAYLCGLLDPNGGHLHPLNYTLGLAKAAQEAGATLHEGSQVVGLKRGRTPVLATAGGDVTADFVVLGGNAYINREMAPELRGRIMPIGNYIVATEPLSDAQVEQSLPQNDAVADANFVLDYYHLSGDRRMLYGGQVSYGYGAPRRLRQRMASKLGRLFPALGDVRIDYQWSGLVGITLNRAPHFGRIGTNIYFSQGYSGHGMAFSGLSGKLISEAVAGQAERFDLYTKIRHRRFPGGEALRTPLLVLATSFYRLRDMF